ncbi:hypothetical protein [Paenibacillus harenae]|uniref:hypothetical protein n=1 Tax=Paenibacillus harenae TaxID=306543 RepID=UPI000420EBA7|nr:hypothetical protein [Paenibacillus harenae]
MSNDRPNHDERITREPGIEAIIEMLSERISGAGLNTLLLEVFKSRAPRSTASELLKKYQANRFVQPASVNPLELKQLELDVLRIADSRSATPVQLSPVAPLGACSAIATVDQNKVISALRGTEVVSDATNLLALHICDLMKSRIRSNRDDFIRFSTTHRHVRAQYFGSAPGMLPHFHLFCMVTSGIDRGSYSFEKQAFREHISVYQDIFQTLFHSELEIVLSIRDGYKDAEGLVERILQDGEQRSVKTSVKEPNLNNPYYKGLQFTIQTTINGREFMIGDGGFVDWSQQMLGNKKERMLISAIGLDRLLM